MSQHSKASRKQSTNKEEPDSHSQQEEPQPTLSQQKQMLSQTSSKSHSQPAKAYFKATHSKKSVDKNTYNETIEYLKTKQTTNASKKGKPPKEDTFVDKLRFVYIDTAHREHHDWFFKFDTKNPPSHTTVTARLNKYFTDVVNISRLEITQVQADAKRYPEEKISEAPPVNASDYPRSQRGKDDDQNDDLIDDDFEEDPHLHKGTGTEEEPQKDPESTTARKESLEEDLVLESKDRDEEEDEGEIKFKKRPTQVNIDTQFKRDDEGFAMPPDTINLDKDQVTFIMSRGRLPYSHIEIYLDEQFQRHTINKLDEHWAEIYDHETSLQMCDPTHFLSEYDQEVADECILKVAQKKYKCIAHEFFPEEAKLQVVEETKAPEEKKKEQNRMATRGATANKDEPPKQAEIKKNEPVTEANHKLVIFINKLMARYRIPFYQIKTFLIRENLTDLLKFCSKPQYLRHIMLQEKHLKIRKDDYFNRPYDRSYIITSFLAAGFAFKKDTTAPASADQWPDEFFPIKKLKRD